jgi:hypothetical protein
MVQRVRAGSDDQNIRHDLQYGAALREKERWGCCCALRQ